MARKPFTTNIRFVWEKSDHVRAIDVLTHYDKSRFKSYSDFVAFLLNKHKDDESDIAEISKKELVSEIVRLIKDELGGDIKPVKHDIPLSVAAEEKTKSESYVDKDFLRRGGIGKNS